MRVHDETLGARQKDVLKHIAPVLAEHGFYLGGGTALALRLGHRRSVDFDWFSGTKLGNTDDLVRRLRGAGLPLRVQETTEGTIHAVLRGVKLTLLEYLYPLLQAPQRASRYGCLLPSLDDLGAMKLSAIAQRGSKRDFIDVYSLLLRKRRLPHLIQAYQKRFGVGDLFHVLYSLVYFTDAEKERMPRMLWKVSWATVKKSLRTWVARYRKSKHLG